MRLVITLAHAIINVSRHEAFPMRPILLCLAISLAALPAVASQRCSPATPVESWCQTLISNLHPTQGGVGMIQVEDEVARLQTLATDQLVKTIRKKAIPVVIGADGVLYLVDRHHFSRALWQLGIRKVSVKVVGKLDAAASPWAQLAAQHWAWLQDEHGQPLDPASIPPQLAQLPDYPYRSLAGLLQDEGYFRKKDKAYFVEFAWGSWLGTQLGWPAISRASLPAQLTAAAKLACSPAAAHLPGYPGKACPSVP